VITKEMNNPTILTRPDLMAKLPRIAFKIAGTKTRSVDPLVRKVVDDLALHMSGLGVQ
jgi:hypothetical protein